MSQWGALDEGGESLMRCSRGNAAESDLHCCSTTVQVT